jgi:hypothetical protein
VPTRFPFRLAILATLLLWSSSHQKPTFAQYAGAESPPERFREGFESIDEKQAQEWLSILAGPSFAGRGTGQPGYMEAANWVASKIAELNWQPIGDKGTYFQNVPLIRIGPDTQDSFIAGPNELKIRGEQDLGFTNCVGDSSVTGKVVFVNARGADQKLPADLSLKDRLAVLVDQESGSRLLQEIWKKRPAAVIRVTQDEPTNRTRIVRQGSSPSKPGRIDVVVSEPAAAKLAAAVGVAAEMVKPREEEGLKVEEVDVELTVEYKLSEEPLPSPNVVAWFEGCDPELKHEHVVIGAHLDHLGLRRGEVYPGADDNASGTVAILQIAEAINRNPERPKRSVLFIAFSAEEMGLIGSRHYCEHPLKPLADMICMLNLDMVGRNEENDKETAEENEDTMHLVGSKKIAIGLHETMLEANRHLNFKLEFDQEKAVFHRSDHLSFHRKDVPVAFIFCGFTPRYHRPTDSLEGINYRKVAAAARLGYLAVMLAAEHGHYERQTEDESDDEKAAAAPP